MYNCVAFCVAFSTLNLFLFFLKGFKKSAILPTIYWGLLASSGVCLHSSHAALSTCFYHDLHHPPQVSEANRQDICWESNSIFTFLCWHKKRHVKVLINLPWMAWEYAHFCIVYFFIYFFCKYALTDNEVKGGWSFESQLNGKGFPQLNTKIDSFSLKKFEGKLLTKQRLLIEMLLHRTCIVYMCSLRGQIGTESIQCALNENKILNKTYFQF